MSAPPTGAHDRAPAPPIPEDFVAGNHFDKYRSSNPIHRWMMGGFLSSARELLGLAAPRSILEVGCGPGDLAASLLDGPDGFRGPDNRGVEYIGTDLSADEITAARRQSPEREFRPASAYELPFAHDSFDLVIACEVMEHLEDPRRAMAEAARVCRPGGHALVSVPWEPVWRVLNFCRGKYVSAWGNTPGHLQHFGRRALCSLVQSQFTIVQVRKPLPWTMVLARKG